MPDDVIHILGFGRKSLDVVKLVTVIPVANVLSHLFLPSVYEETSRNKFWILLWWSWIQQNYKLVLL